MLARRYSRRLRGGLTELATALDLTPHQLIHYYGPVSADIGDTDQRGEVRIAEGQIDIGAFEFESAFLLGDVNRDGAVTFFDIFPFIEVLSANGFQAEADIDQDGAVSFFDISPFIDLLSAPSTGGTTNFSTAFSSVSVPQSDFSSAQLTAAPSAPSLSSSDVAVTQLNAEISDSPVLAFVGGGQVQNLDDTRNLQNGISDRNSGVNAMQLSDEKTDSLAGSQASSAPAVAASSADLFDANPELLDELVDFELDEVFEGLVI